MKCRIAFIAKPKPELIDHLESIGSDLGDYFLQNHVVITEELEYEEYFEGGFKPKIIELCKTHFVVDTIYEVISESKIRIVELLGPFDDEEQLFDHWWYFEDVDCSQIATTWK